MELRSQAKIINYNIDNEAVCASAARISTTKGNAFDIFEKAKNSPNNLDLIKKVMKSGHKSLIEHAVFTIALCNVSAFVEQFFIECRLASFTIKSRRYVDFSNLGYYIPPDLTEDSRLNYCKYMDMMFHAYQTLTEHGIPKEDARFLLPYSFHSNFYCTINARELIHLINTIRYGRGYGIPELNNLADQLVGQIEDIFPCMSSEIKCPSNGCHHIEPLRGHINTQDSPSFIEGKEIGAVSLISSPSNPLHMLNVAYHIKHPAAPQPFSIDLLMKSDRPRELEQLSYTFLISNITLSGITHIVRHRMQSIIVPPIQNINCNKYIVPATVSSDNRLLEFYRNTLTEANRMIKQLSENSLLRDYSYYYILSGNVTDIMTTMNARELKLFTQLRACNRAQWEIRDISIEMLKQLRNHFPELFDHYGPNCFTNGYCPEGGLTCGEMGQVIEKFKKL